MSKLLDPALWEIKTLSPIPRDRNRERPTQGVRITDSPQTLLSMLTGTQSSKLNFYLAALGQVTFKCISSLPWPSSIEAMKMSSLELDSESKQYISVHWKLRRAFLKTLNKVTYQFYILKCNALERGKDIFTAYLQSNKSFFFRHKRNHTWMQAWRQSKDINDMVFAAYDVWEIPLQFPVSAKLLYRVSHITTVKIKSFKI